MLRPFMTGMLVTMERRGLVEVFPEAARKWWKKWQLRLGGNSCTWGHLQSCPGTSKCNCTFRRLLELAIQMAVVVYIMLIAWSGPNYSKFMEEFTMKKAEGFYVKALEVIETRLPTSCSISINNEGLVLKAYDLFQTFKRLFVDLILSFQDRNESQLFFHNLEYEKAFEVIEIELGFAYDVFYTKAPVVYSLTGHIFRLITFLTTFFSLVAFISISHSKKHHFHIIDLSITYLLFGVAIILEICSYLILLFPDWTDCYYKNSIISSFGHLFCVPRKRWSNLIAQCSIQSFCREERSSTWPRILKFLLAHNKVDEIWHLTYDEVSSDLKKLIFEKFLEISKCGNKRDFTVLCTSRGNRVLEKFDCSDLNWSVTEVEFDQSILLWHIATELCYHSENDSEHLEVATSSRREESNHISEYMLYLLVTCPFMLPMGIGMIRFRDTCAEAWEFFKEKRESPNKVHACQMLLRVNTEIPPGKVKGDRCKSVLFDACRLAKELRSKSREDRWEIISQVWVEILAYAACHCRGNQHAQQLRKGGEFLTHVWLLMAHLGITEQFQIDQGHARAKLNAK